MNRILRRIVTGIANGMANKLGNEKTTSATMSTNITNAKVCKSGGGVLPVDCGCWYFRT